MDVTADSFRVLHVDDEPSFGELTARFLTQEDERLDVVPVTSASAALAVFEAERVDCIVSDYEMPLVDGLAFLEAVRARDPHVPFIMFTGQHDDGLAEEAVGAGATAYHRKGDGAEPFSALARCIVTVAAAYREGSARRVGRADADD